MSPKSPHVLVNSKRFRSCWMITVDKLSIFKNAPRSVACLKKTVSPLPNIRICFPLKTLRMRRTIFLISLIVHIFSCGESKRKEKKMSGPLND